MNAPVQFVNEWNAEQEWATLERELGAFAQLVALTEQHELAPARAELAKGDVGPLLVRFATAALEPLEEKIALMRRASEIYADARERARGPRAEAEAQREITTEARRRLDRGTLDEDEALSLVRNFEIATARARLLSARAVAAEKLPGVHEAISAARRAEHRHPRKNVHAARDVMTLLRLQASPDGEHGDELVGHHRPLEEVVLALVSAHEGDPKRWPMLALASVLELAEYRKRFRKGWSVALGSHGSGGRVVDSPTPAELAASYESFFSQLVAAAKRKAAAAAAAARSFEVP